MKTFKIPYGTYEFWKTLAIEFDLGDTYSQ
jgi:hypothetical protein